MFSEGILFDKLNIIGRCILLMMLFDQNKLSDYKSVNFSARSPGPRPVMRYFCVVFSDWIGQLQEAGEQ